MANIIQFPTPIPMTNGNLPQFKFAIFGDNIATVTTAGYLNQSNINSATPLSNADVIMALYSFNIQTQTGTFDILTVAINAATGLITLSEWNSSTGGSVTLPTVANYISHFTNTTGNMSSAAANIINPGNIQAGLSGTAGTVASFPATASRGSLIVAGVANTGNTNTTISNAAMGQASVISIPDPAAATANFVVAPAALVNGNLVAASGTAGLLVDAGVATTNLMSLAAVNTMTGAGQIILVKANGVEAANAVTASGNAGVITTSALTTAGGASYAITWTNTKITATSVIGLTIQGGTNTTQNITFTCAPGAGTATLTIFNNTAATALNGTILIGYTVF